MKYLTIIISILALTNLFTGCQEETAAPLAASQEVLFDSPLLKPASGHGQIQLMNWNIYVGANVDIVLSATDPLDMAIKVAAAYDTLQMTNFPERAAAIARQVAKFKPHVIGLQEVSLIQRFVPGEPYPADHYDYLEILLDALADRKQNYMLADSIHNPDVIVPRLAGFDANGAPVIDYVRVLDSDVILVRDDVSFSDSIKDNYQFNLSIPDLGVSLPRGYVSINAEVNGRNYRIVNTHLEAFAEPFRYAQVQELVATFAGESLPVIMLGDFNTNNPSPPSPYNDATYQFMTESAGYYDTWEYNLYGNQSDGMTYGHASSLMNPVADLYERIDFIFAGNTGPGTGWHPVGPVYAEVVGEEQADRTASGLWPSDHAGLVARLHLSPVVPFAESN